MGTLRDAIVAGMGSLSQAGNAYSDVKRTQFEQALKQFQMQKMTEQLQMQKDMHKLEQMKADMQIKHLGQTMEQENEPLGSSIPQEEQIEGIQPNDDPYGLARVLGPGWKKMTLGKAKKILELKNLGAKDKPSIHTAGGGLYEVPPQGGTATQLVPPVEKPEKESWIDWGHGQKKNAVTGEIAKVPTAPRESSEAKFDKNLLIAAQAAGVAPEKVRSGKLTQDEANKVADKYKEKFGTASLLQALLGGQMGGGQTPTIKYDAQGNVIK